MESTQHHSGNARWQLRFPARKNINGTSSRRDSSTMISIVFLNGRARSSLGPVRWPEDENGGQGGAPTRTLADANVESSASKMFPLPVPMCNDSDFPWSFDNNGCKSSSESHTPAVLHRVLPRSKFIATETVPAPAHTSINCKPSGN